MNARARLRQLAATLRDDYELKGSWRWMGSFDNRPNIFLATRNHGRMFVLGFDRAGMQGGQPVFPHKEPDARWGLLTPGKDLQVFEVARDATDRKDPRVYRGDIVGFRTPVAEYLAAVDAETVIDLIDRADERDQLLAELSALVARWGDAEVDSGILLLWEDLQRLALKYGGDQ